MWVRAAAPAREAEAPDLVCRIAVPSADMSALIGADVPGADVTRVPTWDAPHTLLADDEVLAEAVRDLGVPIARPVSPYAVRQWDEREALEGALHRLRDHDEQPWGMTAFEPRTAVILVRGAGRVREILGRLVRQVAATGLVIDARDAHDLRVFALPVLERGRVLLVRPGETEDLRGDDLDRLLLGL